VTLLRRLDFVILIRFLSEQSDQVILLGPLSSVMNRGKVKNVSDHILH
jgi:hypothetical protein